MAKKSTSKKKKSILIIEDETALAHALALKFEAEGFETTVVHNGREGLKAAKSGTFSVILLDLIMPELDGFTFLEELSPKKKKLSVVVLSNLGQEEDRKRATELGADDYFVKSGTPITEIIKRVKKLA